MKIIKLKMLICVLLLSNLGVYGQNMQVYPTITGLNEFDLPEVYSRIWFELNYSSDNYYINNIGNVSINTGSRSYIYRLGTGNGTLIGTNQGEWGGALVFRGNTPPEYTILNENICGIINFNNEIYVLAGLSHLGISEGKIIKLEIKNGRWECTFSEEFNSSPEAYTIFENKLYIVTMNGLIVFDGNSIQQILIRQFWSGLYPQSIYINEEIIAIGMRGCIAIINRQDNRVRCYKK
jgi:hypothetical protein